MAHWLVKSEPGTYAFADLQRDGKTVWDGVRNPTAAQNLKAMKLGEEVLFYHSGEGKEVVGTATVVKERFPDASDASGRWVAVELAAGHPLPKPVTLADMKANPKLAGLIMLSQGRLSVSPVGDADWTEILRMAGA
jgi:predicted RNA-binding protein with PUA-like domain